MISHHGPQNIVVPPFSSENVTGAQSNQLQLPYRVVAMFCGDIRGAIVSIESITLATILAIGMTVGVTSLRDSIISELSDLSGSVQDINQSYSYSGAESGGTGTTGSDFDDSLDINDDPDDVSGQADNCIVFTAPATDEFASDSDSDSKTVDLSDVSSFSGVNFTSSSAVGTLGDGTIETNFSISTTGGEIRGFTGNTVRFAETPTAAGTYEINFDDPIVDVEFFVGNLINSDATDNNLLGNFTVTLSDGTVLKNASFSVLNDAIAASTTFGEFTTSGSTNELLSQVNMGGVNYVTDPTDSNPGQAAGRIVFNGLPTGSGSDCIGVTRIEFERSGGPDNLSAFFGVSGRVVQEAD